MQQKKIELQILRLDTIHPLVSGNKIFKLNYFLQTTNNKPIITFGGAYSNHLLATAYACFQKNIKCVGVVRGEKPDLLSHTLQQCLLYKMELRFISRALYDEKETQSFLNDLIDAYGDCTIIPEGGYDKKGAEGAASIMDYIDADATHICCAVGTATTLAGLVLNTKPQQKIIGIPVLKGLNDVEARISFLTGEKFNKTQLTIESNYHFGGYAKRNTELIAFMNKLYTDFNLPTDFVYTGKMMYAVMDMIEKGSFAQGSKICCIHTGGLQGNLSLPKNTLTF